MKNIGGLYFSSYTFARDFLVYVGPLLVYCIFLAWSAPSLNLKILENAIKYDKPGLWSIVFISFIIFTIFGFTIGHITYRISLLIEKLISKLIKNYCNWEHHYQKESIFIDNAYDDLFEITNLSKLTKSNNYTDKVRSILKLGAYFNIDGYILCYRLISARAIQVHVWFYFLISLVVLLLSLFGLLETRFTPHLTIILISIKIATLITLGYIKHLFMSTIVQHEYSYIMVLLKIIPPKSKILSTKKDGFSGETTIRASPHQESS